MGAEQRLIDANKLKDKFLYLRKMWSETEIVLTINDAKTVDAVEVVRCRDCKHAGINENHPSKPLLCFLTRMCGSVDPEWYCWQGERKGNGN